jgi:predicted DsbA family dithiol-disulfide isomerase
MDTVFGHFGDTLKFYFKPRPIIKERTHWLRSKALLASLKQNRFWEMEAALSKIGTVENTDNVKNRMENQVIQCAESLHLDLALFKTDLYSKDTEKELEAVIAETEKYGITKYPFLFINKRPVWGVRNSDYYIKKIHQVIRAMN